MTTERDDRRGGDHGAVDAAFATGGRPLPQLPQLPPPSPPGAGELTGPFVPVLPPRSPVAAPAATPEFGRHVDGPTAPASGVAVSPGGWSPDGVVAAHRSTNAQRNERVGHRRRSTARRIVSWAVAGVVVAVIGLLAVQLVRGIQEAREARALPTFAATRPPAGTVVIEVAESAGPDSAEFHSTVKLNPTSSDFEIAGQGGGDSLGLIRVDGTVFVDDGIGWVELDPRDAEQVDRDLALMTRLSIFDDYVPEAARPFVLVLDGDRDELRGREVRRLDLFLDDEEFRRADRAAFDAWAAANGVADDPPDDRAYHFELWCDDDGVIWRVRSETRNPRTGELEDWVQLDLVSIDEAPFVAGVPGPVVTTVA